MDNARSENLEQALRKAGLELPADQIESLERYCAALWSWNEKINLTRHTDYDKFVQRDIADTMALEQFIETGEYVLDVGTGGGVPGVPLSIIRPDITVTLCDSVGKKAKAVEEIVRQAGLDLAVHHERAEILLDDHQFDTLILRAVAPMAKVLTWFAPHWPSFYRLLMIKGPAWVEERLEAREQGLLKHLELRKLLSYPLAGTDSDSVVLQLRPQEDNN